MKNLLLLSASAFAIFAASCSGMMEMKKINAVEVDRINDTLKNLPGTFSMHVLQDDDFSTVTVIVGNKALYGAGNETIQQAAIMVGTMVLTILGPDASISRARFVVTQKDTDAFAVPDDGISADMKIDSMKKVLFRK